MRPFQDWLSEGETIYAGTLEEFRSIESQIETLEQQLAAKRTEVNQIAQVIGKPPVESKHHRVSAQIVEADQYAASVAHAIPAGRMAQALTGRAVGAR